MKFRYKVLIINIILLSISLGIIGYLMIRKNFELAENSQVQNAILENNLVQSSVEYEILQLLNSQNYYLQEELPKIGGRAASSMRTTNSSFYIKYGQAYVYASDDLQASIPESLFSNLNVGEKKYVVVENGGAHKIYVTSYSEVKEQGLCVINCYDSSEAYKLMEDQIAYFRFLLVVILVAASAAMYAVSYYLTRPLESLNHVSGEIAQGNYDIRAKVSTNDEVGLLAEKFNLMAESVSDHVDELNEMIHRRDQFVADFTHEIKTPMTTIIGYADTMRSLELSRQEQMMSLNYIFSEGKRLEALSGKLFELIYLRDHEIEKEQIHVEDLAKEIAQVVAPVLEKKKIQLKVKVEAGMIHGNRELLVTAFYNLIDNARKASPEESTIILAGRQGEDFYELLVEDHGIGMTQEDAKRICNEFYMVDKSRSRKEGGAGIGMSLVALIMERHEAELSIESELGEGTTMKVRFLDGDQNI
ncbi:MAG: HAMP domain-containing protein [Agathobacter sp.]|nr:HAMP domain-containing protein [Agathobacter sp.]